MYSVAHLNTIGRSVQRLNGSKKAPGRPDVIIESPLDLIFRDLFYRVPLFAGRNDVFLKLEGFNVTGSIKIKTAIALVEDLEQRGVARTDETVIVESSSGNLGLALSLVCAAKRYKFVCVTDPNANRATIRGMELYGAKVVVVEERDAAGGYLGSRLKKIKEILRSNPNAVWLNQYANVANKKVHAEQTANEIVREFDQVDWIFVGTGTTGTLAGISERLRQKFSNVTIVAVEPVGSITFGGAPAKRNIPGIGTSVRPALADLAKPDRIVAVTEEKTVEACLPSFEIIICSLGEAPDRFWPQCNNWLRSFGVARPSSLCRLISARNTWTLFTTRPGWRRSSRRMTTSLRGLTRSWPPREMPNPTITLALRAR